MRRQYTDAEKADYWRKKALAKSTPQRAYYTPKRSPPPYQGRSAAYYKYKSKESAAKREATKEPGILSAAGSALGAAIPGGGPLASFLGGKIGHLVEKITGFGDYKVEYNTLLTGGMSPPQVVNSVNNGGFLIRHREFIADIEATVGFSVRSYLINPGLSGTFPWLSQIANSFDQYRLRGMLFEFKSTSSDAVLSSSTSTALGSVVMSTDYDVADDVPSDKASMLNNEYSSSSKPSCSFIHPIECKRGRSAINLLFTRGVYDIPANFDQRLYDFARFNIATVGMQAAEGVLGELWVTYEIELLKQQTAPVLTPFDHFQLSGTFSIASPFGTIQAPTETSNFGGTIVDVVPGEFATYAFPQDVANGVYLATWWVTGSTNVASGVTLPTVYYINCSGRPVLNNSTQSSAGCPSPANNTQTVTCMIQFVITVAAREARFNFGSPLSLPSSVTRGDLIVTRVADNFA